MKKSAVIFLIGIYALASMGFALKEFYCCGELQSINLTLLPDTKKNCDKGEEDGCCENKYKFYKVKDKHILSDKTNNSVNLFTDLHLLYFTIPGITTFPAEKTVIAYSSHAPPADEGVSIFLLNCVFRI